LQALEWPFISSSQLLPDLSRFFGGGRKKERKRKKGKKGGYAPVARLKGLFLARKKEKKKGGRGGDTGGS